MLKKLIVLVSLFALAAVIGIPALAEAPALNEDLFDRGKEVMSLVSYGEFDRAFATAGFVGDGTAEDFKNYMTENFFDIFSETVQQEVAVFYYDGATWTLALPVKEPTDDNVEVLMLTAADGQSFDGYLAGAWGDVLDAVDQSDSAIWNQEYQPGEVIVQADAWE